MKKQSRTNNIIRSGFAVALVMMMSAWFPVQAQSAEHMQGEKMTQAKMMECCKAMMVQKQKMMADMKAQNAELSAQVAGMNSASQEKKLDLIAAIITRMVEQKSTMDASMEKMQAERMQHMMQHMQMGSESIAECPMMKDMDKKLDKTNLQHSQEKK